MHPSQPSEADSPPIVAAYFAAMRQSAELAMQYPGQIVARALAGNILRFHMAGEFLGTVLQTAIEHLPISNASDDDLTLYVWDETATGVTLPEAPWPWPNPDQAVELALPRGAEDFHPLYEPLNGVFGLYQESTRTAVIHIKDAHQLPTPWHGAPLFRIFHWWSHSVGLVLIHAGCVGTDHGAVLLAGKGGSGKSTTSLLCLAEQLRYVSDDYCLINARPEPRAFALYNTGKLHRDHLNRFPALAKRAVEPARDEHEKKVIFAHQHFPAQLASSLPVRAVVLPRICGGPHHRFVTISAMEALRGLAPSTLLQVSGYAGRHLQAMAQLVRNVPCYRLELGENYATIPRTIADLIDRLTDDSSPTASP